MPEATVSSKGWIVIPSEMRKKYDLQPGSKVSVVDYGGILSIVPHRGDADVVNQVSGGGESLRNHPDLAPV